MSKKVCVIGLGRFGAKLAATLHDSHHDVTAIDRDGQKVQSMREFSTWAVEADATDDKSLRDLGVDEVSVAVVALGNQIQSSIITTMLLKSMGVPFVMAQAMDERHGNMLGLVGADKVLVPEEEAAVRAASLSMNPHHLDFVSITDLDCIHKLRPTEAMRGKSLRDVGLAGDDGSRPVVILLQRGYEYVMNPRGDEVIGEGDILFVVGSHEAITRLLGGRRLPGGSLSL